jgi:hypothetical protein
MGAAPFGVKGAGFLQPRRDPNGHVHRQFKLRRGFRASSQSTETSLRSRRSPLHYLQLLSPSRISGHSAIPRLLRQCPRRRPRPSSISSFRLCGDARARSPANKRTTHSYSLHRSAGLETKSVTRTGFNSVRVDNNSASRWPGAAKNDRRFLLAKALLRLQRLESRQNQRETLLHARESRKTEFSG